MLLVADKNRASHRAQNKLIRVTLNSTRGFCTGQTSSGCGTGRFSARQSFSNWPTDQGTLKS